MRSPTLRLLTAPVMGGLLVIGLPLLGFVLLAACGVARLKRACEALLPENLWRT